jgi:hypothetical protein
LILGDRDFRDGGVRTVLQHFPPPECPGHRLDHALSTRRRGAVQVSVVPSIYGSRWWSRAARTTSACTFPPVLPVCCGADVATAGRAESELGVLASQCLDRRIADKQILAHEVTAWQDHRNKHHAKADWQFTTANARVKLKRLYPQFE